MEPWQAKLSLCSCNREATFIVFLLEISNCNITCLLGVHEQSQPRRCSSKDETRARDHAHADNLVELESSFQGTSPKFGPIVLDYRCCWMQRCEHCACGWLGPTTQEVWYQHHEPASLVQHRATSIRIGQLRLAWQLRAERHVSLFRLLWESRLAIVLGEKAEAGQGGVGDAAATTTRCVMALPTAVDSRDEVAFGFCVLTLSKDHSAAACHEQQCLVVSFYVCVEPYLKCYGNVQHSPREGSHEA